MASPNRAEAPMDPGVDSILERARSRAEIKGEVTRGVAPELTVKLGGRAESRRADGSIVRNINLGLLSPDGRMLVGHKNPERAGAVMRLDVRAKNEDSAREKAAEALDRLSAEYEQAMDATMTSVGVSEDIKGRVRDVVKGMRNDLVAEALRQAQPDSALVDLLKQQIEAVVEEQKLSKAEQDAREMQLKRSRLLELKGEYAVARGEADRAEHAGNERAYQEAMNKVYAIERDIVGLREAEEPGTPKAEIQDQVEGYIDPPELTPDAVENFTVAITEGQIKKAENRMRELDKVLMKTPDDAAALTEWTMLDAQRKADYASLPALREAEAIKQAEADAQSLYDQMIQAGRKGLEKARARLRAEKSRIGKFTARIAALVGSLEDGMREIDKAPATKKAEAAYAKLEGQRKEERAKITDLQDRVKHIGEENEYLKSAGILVEEPREFVAKDSIDYKNFVSNFERMTAEQQSQAMTRMEQSLESGTVDGRMKEVLNAVMRELKAGRIKNVMPEGEAVAYEETEAEARAHAKGEVMERKFYKAGEGAAEMAGEVAHEIEWNLTELRQTFNALKSQVAKSGDVELKALLNFDLDDLYAASDAAPKAGILKRLFGGKVEQSPREQMWYKMSVAIDEASRSPNPRIAGLAMRIDDRASDIVPSLFGMSTPTETGGGRSAVSGRLEGEESAGEIALEVARGKSLYDTYKGAKQDLNGYQAGLAGLEKSMRMQPSEQTKKQIERVKGQVANAWRDVARYENRNLIADPASFDFLKAMGYKQDEINKMESMAFPIQQYREVFNGVMEDLNKNPAKDVLLDELGATSFDQFVQLFSDATKKDAAAHIKKYEEIIRATGTRAVGPSMGLVVNAAEGMERARGL